MILFMLIHHSDGDYYQKDATPLGVYTTRRKAINAMERHRSGFPKDYRGALFDLTDRSQFINTPDYWYEIKEAAVDRDWF